MPAFCWFVPVTAHLFRNRLAVDRARCYVGPVSSEGSDAPRHVGRIVDPDVRDDGGLEPSVEIGAPPHIDEPQPPETPVVEHSVAEPVLQQDDTIGVQQLLSQPIPLNTETPRLKSGAGLALAGAPRPESSPLPRLDPDVLTAAGPAATSPHAPAASRESNQAGFPVSESRGSAPPRVADFEGLVEEGSPQRRSRDLELELVGEGLLKRPHAHRLPPKSPMSPQLVAGFGAFLGILIVSTIIAIAMRLDQVKLPVQPVVSANPSASSGMATAPEKRPEPKRRQREKVPGPYRVKDSANDAQIKIVEGKVGYEPFLKAVEKAGVPLKEAYRLLIAFEKVHSLNDCSRSDKFVAAIDRSSKRLKAFELITGPEEIFQAKEGPTGLLVAEKLDLKVKRERVTGAFAVGGTGLESAVVEGSFEPQLLRSMREALIGHLSLEEIERGSRVRVIAQEVTALGEFARYAGIEALEIQFPSDKKRLRVYYFSGPKSRGFFDESARSPYEGGWRSPIPNAPVTSKFNMRRMHPVLHKIMPHTGTDFGAAMGVPIGASSFGTITFLGWGGATGNFIRIEHSGGIETGYAHMSRFAEGLKVGDKVKRLQTIGYVGSTGRSTGPHLHFTAKRDGKFIDPQSLHLDALRVLPSDEREVFMQHKVQYDAQLDAIELPALTESASPASSPTASGHEGFEEESMDGEETAGSAAPPAPAPIEESAAPAADSPKSGGSALYLTDEELLRMQKSSESGEVAE